MFDSCFFCYFLSNINVLSNGVIGLVGFEVYFYDVFLDFFLYNFFINKTTLFFSMFLDLLYSGVFFWGGSFLNFFYFFEIFEYIFFLFFFYNNTSVFLFVDALSSNLNSVFICNYFFSFFFFILYLLIFFNISSLVLFNNFLSLSSIGFGVSGFLISFFVEVEKEIGSVDDLLGLFVCVFFLFGLFFFSYGLVLFLFFCDFFFLFFFLGVLFFFIIFFISFLLYDFGLLFFSYLRGVGSGSLFSVELVFDYIALIIFYTRISVQTVRLVLMFFTYFSFYDFILFFYNTLNTNVGFQITGFYSYFFFFDLPGNIIYFFYELFHLFFVVTVQFFAFFGIVLWLFLFLYSFFVSETQESFFVTRRAVYVK